MHTLKLKDVQLTILLLCIFKLSIYTEDKLHGSLSLTSLNIHFIALTYHILLIKWEMHAWLPLCTLNTNACTCCTTRMVKVKAIRKHNKDHPLFLLSVEFHQENIIQAKYKERGSISEVPFQFQWTRQVHMNYVATHLS